LLCQRRSPNTATRSPGTSPRSSSS
jgi:hypothetical protein